MKPEDFEQRLARTPRTGAPPAWRTEILAAAKVARVESAEEPRREGLLGKRAETVLGTGWRKVGEWIRGRLAWASPWGVLAAGWAVVLAVNGAGAWMESRPSALVTVTAPRPASALGSPAAILVAARHYRAEVVAMAERDDAAVESTPKPASTPAGQVPPRTLPGRPRTEWDPGRRGAALSVGGRLA